MNDAELDALLEERLATMPAVVQRAILSADVEKHLRSLADEHKLHLDQWQTLENEVMMTLLGLKQAENLEENIIADVGVDAAVAHELALGVSVHVFEPIREELERQLEHPAAEAATVNPIDASRAQILKSNAEENAVTPSATTPIQPAISPATPPQDPPAVAIATPAVSVEYAPGTPSAARKSIESDPYREPIS